MTNPTRVTTCGHYPYSAKGLCGPCYQRAYYAANRAKLLARATAWGMDNADRKLATNRAGREANPARYAAYFREYSVKNAERKREVARQWREANPEKVRALSRASANRRRARKYADADLTNGQWQAILVEFDHRCAYCNCGGVPMEMEHMTPLSRGGRHTASNVVPACGPCNREKHMKTALEWIGPRAGMEHLTWP